MKDNYFSTIEEFKTTLPAKKLMGLAKQSAYNAFYIFHTMSTVS